MDKSIFWCWSLSWMLISSIEIWSSLEHLCHLWVCVLLMALSPDTCFNILKVSEIVFPNLKQNFTKTHCSWKPPNLNCSKICKQYMRPLLTDTAQWLSKLEWSGLWHSRKETHCYTTQLAGAHSPLHWCTNSNFENFTDWLNVSAWKRKWPKEHLLLH